MARRLVSISLLAVLCSACGTRPTSETEGMVRLRLTNQQEVTPEHLTTDYRYVPLGKTRQPVGGIDQLLFTDDRIVVVDRERTKAIFIFDHEGIPRAEIYGFGRGPQEYTGLEHVALVPGDDPLLALLDGRSRKVVFYDLDGRFVRSLPIPFRFNGMEYLDKDEVLCYAAASIRHDPFFRNRKDADRLLFFTDGAFGINASTLTCRIKSREISYTIPVVKRSGQELLVNPNLNDTIYRIDAYGLQPLYFVDLSALGAEQPTEELTDEQAAELGTSGPAFTGFFTSGDNYLFVDISMPPDRNPDRYCYSKASGKIYRLKISPRSGDAALADVAFPGIQTSWQDQYVSYIPAYAVPMVYRNGTDNPLLKNIDEDANPVLIFYKLREPEL